MMGARASRTSATLSSVLFLVLLATNLTPAAMPATPPTTARTLMRMSNVYSWLGVFAAMALVDAAWAAYIQAVAKASDWAAFWSAAQYLLGATVVISVTRDPRLIFPAAAGAYAGTALAVG
jgi:hypothetical protein